MSNLIDQGIRLDGVWEFYTNNWILESTATSSQPKWIQIPSSWNEFFQNDLYPQGFGYGTYQVIIQLDPNEKDITLKIPDIGSAYELFINEKSVLRRGIATKEPEGFEGKWLPAILPIQSHEGTIKITLHVSNFFHTKGGLWGSILLGRHESIHKNWVRSVTLDMMIFGSLLIMSIYQFGTYLLQRKERSHLFFSLVCLIIALRTIVTGEYFIVYAFPTLPLELTIRLEYLTFYLSPVFFFQFLYELYPEVFNKSIKIIVYFIFILLSVSVFLLPVKWFTLSLNFGKYFVLVCALYLIFVLGKAAWKRLEGAKFIITGFGILTVTLINDVLNNDFIINTFLMVPAGLIGFIVAQSFVLARRHLNLYKKAESLTATLVISNSELLLLKESLEDKIIERTWELASSRDEINKLAEFSRETNSSIEAEELIDKMFIFVARNFNIENIVLYNVDKEKKEFIFNKSTGYVNQGNRVDELIRHHTIPFNEEGGVFWFTYKRKKPFYLSKIPRKVPNASDKFVIETTGVSSILAVPLMNFDEVVAMAIFGFYDPSRKLSKRDIQTLNAFCAQIAGSIQRSILLKKSLESQNKLANIGKMASGIVHDLKNPIASIKGFAEVAAMDDHLGAETRKEYLSIISKEIDRLSDMTYEIIDYARGKVNLSTQIVSSDEYFQEIINFINFDLQARNISLYYINQFHGTVEMDGERIRRAILNLTQNARDAMLQTSHTDNKVTLEVSQEGENLRIDVKDNGPGIPEEIADKIFHEYATFGKAKGSGLGLINVKNTVQAHGGSVSFKSERGKGTVFTILIPLYRSGSAGSVV